MTRKQRAEAIIEALEKAYPDAQCSLDFKKDAWQLMVSAILATQCTDKRVNMVTPALFERYKSVYDFASANEDELIGYIRSTGFFNHKAKNIIASAKIICDKYGGAVPDTIDELVTLPGVGRKIANLLLGDVFGKPCIVVDTHAKRLSYRMGLTKNTEPVKIEFDLRKIIPAQKGSDFCHRLVNLGREYCVRNPKCGICPVGEVCKKELK